MKVKHVALKVSKVCSKHLNKRMRVVYLKSESNSEIMDYFLLDHEKSLEFLQNKDTLIATVAEE